MEYRSELTTVYYVGHGEDCQQKQIQRLIDGLGEFTLDPKFEKYGNFIIRDEPKYSGAVSFFGNFFDYSLVFRIDTTDQVLIDELTRLIRQNQRSDAYKRARIALNEPHWSGNLYK